MLASCLHYRVLYLKHIGILGSVLRENSRCLNREESYTWAPGLPTELTNKGCAGGTGRANAEGEEEKEREREKEHGQLGVSPLLTGKQLCF